MKNSIIKPNSIGHNKIILNTICFHRDYFILGRSKGAKLAALATYLVILGTEDPCF